MLALGSSRRVVVLGLVGVLLVGLLAATAGATHPRDDDEEPPRSPPVKGFYDNHEIFFIHTEASDPEVAQMLEDMTGSAVVTVPELAEVPDEALANVYAFTNGVKPEGARGPFGFQPDVFDSAPGDEDYSPLRQVNLVKWKDESEARVLTNDHRVKAMERAGKLTIKPTSVVVNMPMLSWPGGER